MRHGRRRLTRTSVVGRAAGRSSASKEFLTFPRSRQQRPGDEAHMKTAAWIVPGITAAMAAIVLSGATAAAPQADAPALAVPLRMTAFAVSMGTAATGANAVMDIRVTRWSTAEERQKL